MKQGDRVKVLDKSIKTLQDSDMYGIIVGYHVCGHNSTDCYIIQLDEAYNPQWPGQPIWTHIVVSVHYLLKLK